MDVKELILKRYAGITQMYDETYELDYLDMNKYGINKVISHMNQT